jgi:uncharacterized protein with LGFP repeats
VRVPISATAVSGAPHLTVPTSLSFGDVPVGLGRTLTFPIANDGNIAMTINKAKAPAGAFSTDTPIAEGLVIPPGETAYQSVTFTPTTTGQAGAPDTYYLITTDDGTGAHEVMLTGNGVSDPLAVLGSQHGGTYATLLGVVASAPFRAGDGQCQSYTNGYVCASPTAGQHYVSGPIAATYRAAGGPTGPLGLPMTDLTPVGDGVGSRANFTGAAGPSIFYTPGTGAHLVRGAIKAKWLAMGGPAGTLGYPVTDEFCGLRGGGCGQHFSKAASIYWSAATGAHFVRGAIRTKWSATGWETNLGYPVTDEFCGLRGGGCGQHFSQTASIYWSPATGAHLVRRAIRSAWAALGWETGQLGYPTSDEFCGLVGGGCGEHFQGGSIYWSAATGAHAVLGALRAYWGSTGWERGSLGYPTSNQYSANGMVRQNFQRGYLLFDPRTGRTYRH